MISTTSCVVVASQKSAAIMGSLASIKPILWIDTEGKLSAHYEVRGRKKPSENYWS